MGASRAAQHNTGLDHDIPSRVETLTRSLNDSATVPTVLIGHL
jgi:hypothetical protein